MNSLAKLLKETISRTAGKRARSETQALRKATAQHRKAIADLSGRVRELERALLLIRKKLGSIPAVPAKAETSAFRFSAKGLQSMRSRLGLSAAQCGMLLGVSAQAIGKWERGESRPSDEKLALLAGLRTMGKRDVKAKLAALSKQ